MAWLFHAECYQLVEYYGITGGSLGLDEVDRERSKRTTHIYKAHKQRHKSSEGYVNGQCIVLFCCYWLATK